MSTREFVGVVGTEVTGGVEQTVISSLDGMQNQLPPDLLAGLDGKRVRVTVEVLPDDEVVVSKARKSTKSARQGVRGSRTQMTSEEREEFNRNMAAFQLRFSSYLRRRQRVHGRETAASERAARLM